MKKSKSDNKTASLFAYASLIMIIICFCSWEKSIGLFFAISAIVLAIIAKVLKYKGIMPIIVCLLAILLCFSLFETIMNDTQSLEKAKKYSEKRTAEIESKQQEIGTKATFDYFNEQRNEMLSRQDISQEQKIAAAVSRFWGLMYYYSEGYYNICRLYGVDFTPFLNKYSKINYVLEQETIEKAKLIGVTKSLFWQTTVKINGHVFDKLSRDGFDMEMKEIAQESGEQFTEAQYCKIMIWCIQDAECQETYDFSLIEPQVTAILKAQ